MSKNKRFPLPLRYPGGKHYAMNILRPFFGSVEHDEYREPFAGGATVFFNKEKSKYNWLNDKDSELICLYNTLKDRNTRSDFALLFENEPEATKERWKEVFNFQPKNNIEIAWKYYFLNRTSFSGKLVSAAWGYRPKRSLPPFRWHERINPAGEKLEGVYLTDVDFQDVINASPMKADNDVLMYVDPPYFKPPKHKHYRNGLDLEDHVRLSECLRKTKHKFFLTYDDCDEIRELYKWANIFELQFFYRVQDSNTSSGSRKTGFELVISNFIPECFVNEVSHD
ncbi:DNA adenine methylase [Vibrio parahaemolyticus]|uniref:DNA adenine methylase n=1 Tax=Vibrio parahaemolyticus TaxID=670 RepID=UPI000423ED0C|nr:DNA adenine methylase [Vibrio parahaemolyticus]MCZ6382456.1 DNA adenine methylase [Vibrio parahaemolyticus]